jgi:hypothetical protein
MFLTREKALASVQIIEGYTLRFKPYRGPALTPEVCSKIMDIFQQYDGLWYEEDRVQWILEGNDGIYTMEMFHKPWGDGKTITTHEMQIEELKSFGLEFEVIKGYFVKK